MNLEKINTGIFWLGFTTILFSFNLFSQIKTTHGILIYIFIFISNIVMFLTSIYGIQMVITISKPKEFKDLYKIEEKIKKIFNISKNEKVCVDEIEKVLYENGVLYLEILSNDLQNQIRSFIKNEEPKTSYGYVQFLRYFKEKYPILSRWYLKN